MKPKLLAVLLLIGIACSVGYGATISDEAALGPTDNETSATLVFGATNPNNQIPGGNVIDGSSSAANNQTGNLVNAAVAVPEPSATLLISLGAVGFILLKLRRWALLKRL